MRLIGARIEDSEAWFLRIDGTELLDVEFVDTRFRGAQLDLSGFAGVRFLSREESPHFLSNNVGIIEDSWIVQNEALPSAGVLDLAAPEQEILFDGIQFHSVRFEGAFKPAWFRRSEFVDCTFPAELGERLKADPQHTVEVTGP